MSYNIKVVDSILDDKLAKIIDSTMGSGKTTKAIEMINTSPENFIFVTPFLSEVQRVKKSCRGKLFYEPENYGKGKLDSLHRLLRDKRNIASTHALFQMATDETRELIRKGNYILILDEVINVIEEIKVPKGTLDSYINSGYLKQDGELLRWNEEFKDVQIHDSNLKNMAMNSNLVYHKDSFLFWMFPIESFKLFKEVYVLTYMFDAQIQKYYFDLNNVDCSFYEVIKYNEAYLMQPKDNIMEQNFKRSIRKKIHILYDDKLNEIGEDKYALSSTWHNRAKDEDIKKLKNNLQNFFIHKINSKSNDNMWTSFKNTKNKIAGKGYTKGFVPCNARATNDFSHKNTLAYCVNVFINPTIKQYFNSKGIEMDEDKYALSEMLQWIWRSSIRNGEEIVLYIPSKRMRDLFTQWLYSDEIDTKID